MKENAKQALAACKQGKLTIGEYNSKFSSLVYLVEDVEDACIEKYMSGLNPWIKDWLLANALETWMVLALEVAAQLDLLAVLPLESPSASHHPFLN